MWKKRRIRMLVWMSLFWVGLIAGGFFLQLIWAHRFGQKYFKQDESVVCTALLGWFSREDKRVNTKTGEVVTGPDFKDLQPGDILLTLSTHSLGWRHGHAALVVDETTTLECALWGSNSGYGDPRYFRNYSGYCVLRVKDVPEEIPSQVADYAGKYLYDIPYHISAGFIGPKAPEVSKKYFGLQCSYLVWYAWNHFGYDIDADGGRLVTATDLLESDLLEIVQSYGIE